MLASRPDLKATIADQSVRVVIMASSSVLSDLPEISDKGESSWDEGTRGGGVGPTSDRPVLVIAVENLLCYGTDVYPYEDIFVHEFAHGVLNMGLERQFGGEEFRRRLEADYEAAMEAGLWAATYASENPDEYWAEGVQSWFGLNDPPGFIHNDVNTRAELEEYDPALAGLIREVFGDGVISASCHEAWDINKDFRIQGTVTGPDGEPLEGIALWAWQGEVANSGYGETGADGRFNIEVPHGSFTLDVYTGAGCIGWYDGEGGISSVPSKRARIVVENASVEGIEIRLPDDPDELPQVGC